MQYQTIIYQEKDGIGFVTINRPKKLNALNTECINELFDVFENIKNNEAVRVVIITGAGDKAFVAGADVEELSQLNQHTGKAKMHRGQGLFNLIENLGKPVIAAVNGFALGGGCELALACTIRLCAANAKFGQPEVNLGIIPGYGGTQRLGRLVGKGRAMEMILTGEAIDASEAYRIGLVNKVYPQEQLLTETENVARKIMTRGPLAVKAAMESINRGMEMTLAEGLNLEANLFALLCETGDGKEGMKAFLEKRPPQFHNQ
ncbi:MAG: enoyl-CoA hydratase/isomerase family protein [Planctomycetes bacterium]|nr:enoyl-CoA hydratase/isomerase family protein [Planctomycetota bacterium]